MKIKCLGIMTFLLVFGIVVVGCDSDGSGPRDSVGLGPYNMEIYYISTATFDSLMAGNYPPGGSYTFVRSQPGTNRHSTHTGQTLEEIQQRLERLGVGNLQINNALTSLQQGSGHNIWWRNSEGTIVYFYMYPR